MSQDGVNKTRRTLLISSTAAIGAVGAVCLATPFVASMMPSQKAKAVGAPIKIDISKLEPGAMITEAWRGKPVYIVKRTEESLATLDGLTQQLKDPNSLIVSQQPDYALNQHRSRKPDIIVLIGICTHLNCVPRYVPELAPQPFDSKWQGGFFCACHNSRFDIAGRVFSGSPASSNLLVPPHYYESDTVLVVGLDEALENG